MRSRSVRPRSPVPTVLALLCTSAPFARGQGPDGDRLPVEPLGAGTEGQPAHPPPPDTPGVDSWNVWLGDGFTWTSADGKAALELGGLLQTDWQWNGTDRAPESEIELRKMRLDFGGRFGETFRFKLSPDFAEERGPLDQAWVGAEIGERDATLLFGRSTVPFGLEEVRNRAGQAFARFSILDQFAPQQQPGVFLNGGGEEELLEWNLAAFDGSDFEDETSDEGAAGRLALHPFTGREGFLEHLHIGLAGTYGNVNGDLSGDFVDNAAGLPVMQYAEGVSLDGQRTRLGVELAWRRGPWFAQGEWSQTSQDMALDGASQSIDFRGWYVEVSRVLTGETNDYFPVRPSRPFSTKELSGLGAWTLALRYSELHSDEGLQSAGLTIPGAYVEDVQSVWLGLNWAPVPQVVLRNSFVHSFYSDDVFLDGEPVSGESAFIVQLQLSF